MLCYTYRFINYVLHLYHANTPLGSKQNIHEHYDVGNEFFGTFLDERWCYSCALYKSPNDSLEHAQRNKLDMVLGSFPLRSFTKSSY